MQTKGFMGRKWLWIDFGQVFLNAALKAHIDVKVDFFFIPKTWKFGGQNGLNWRAHTHFLEQLIRMEPESAFMHLHWALELEMPLFFQCPMFQIY